MSTEQSSHDVGKTQLPNEEPVDNNVMLAEELKVRTEERDQLKSRLLQTELQLADVTARLRESAILILQNGVQPQSPVKSELEKDENLQLRDTISNLKIVAKDKTTACSRYALQVQALETQVAALKEVTSLTKGMLSIRNTENEKLKEQIDLMQKKVDSERVRNNAVLKKTELASSLNVQLRAEYQNQVKLIGELRQKYEKKINILTDEVARLEKEKKEKHLLTNGEMSSEIE